MKVAESFLELSVTDRSEQDRIINDFKNVVKNDNNSYEKIIDKYLLFGTPYIFKDDENKFYELKSEIADFFGVSQTNIFVVGSAKLGFSIAPKKRYKYFDEESDIDVAIIDGSLFLRYWKELYRFNTDVRAKNNKEKDTYEKFLGYFFKGWLRPDKFPKSMQKRNDWFDFFKRLQRKYKYEIAAGIYYDIDVFAGYNKENLERMREELNHV